MRALINELKQNIQQLDDLSSCSRVFHGRGKTLAGYEDITVEYLSGLLLVIMFGERPSSWWKALTEEIVSTIESLTVDDVVFQARYQPQAPVFNSAGNPVTLDKVINESGLKYYIHIGGRQNFGFFTDMKNGRNWVKEHSSERRVLNLFSYTCSFSVAAIEGGAEKVVNVDMSSAALSVGRKNHQLNQHDLRSVMFQKLNILKSWGRIKKFGPYDLIIVDPPSFQKGSFSVNRDYQKVVNRLAEMTAPDGDVLFCLNDPLVTIDDFEVFLKNENFEYVSRIENPEVMKEVQQDVGLKVLHYRKVASA